MITLALALGANTAIFSVVHATLLNPLVARDPGRLVVAWESDPAKGVAVVELAYNTFRDWATHSRSFTHAGAFGSSTWTEVLRGVDESVRLASTAVSATFFDTLGARPMLGRTFRAEDEIPNGERAVLLSHTLWKTRFGGASRSSVRRSNSIILMWSSASCPIRLLWVYYSCQILLLGAEFTRVYAQRYGTKPGPESFAERDLGVLS